MSLLHREKCWCNINSLGHNITKRQTDIRTQIPHQYPTATWWCTIKINNWIFHCSDQLHDWCLERSNGTEHWWDCWNYCAEDGLRVGGSIYFNKNIHITQVDLEHRITSEAMQSQAASMQKCCGYAVMQVCRWQETMTHRSYFSVAIFIPVVIYHILHSGWVVLGCPMVRPFLVLAQSTSPIPNLELYFKWWGNAQWGNMQTFAFIYTVKAKRRNNSAQ